MALEISLAINAGLALAILKMYFDLKHSRKNDAPRDPKTGRFVKK